jgi:hypothetical protein
MENKLGQDDRVFSAEKSHSLVPMEGGGDRVLPLHPYRASVWPQLPILQVLFPHMALTYESGTCLLALCARVSCVVTGERSI